MNRGIGTALGLIFALGATLFSVTACARDTAPAAAAAPAAAPARPGATTNWSPGTHYEVLGRPQPTDVASGKVEVIEFFWYGCPHCYALEETLEKWTKTKPAYVDFSRTHVIWGPMHRQHAKLYYTLQALGRLDLHAKVFEAFHRDHNMLAAQDEAQARAMHQAFCEANGVSKKDFDAAYDSMSVATNLQRAEEKTYRYAIQSVPTMVIDGKYETNVSMAGGAAELLQLVDSLAAREKKP
jgi:protein dithiol oxidoreductase (disulfide-forming)